MNLLYYITLDGEISIKWNYRTIVLRSDHPNYEKIKAALIIKDFDLVKELLSHKNYPQSDDNLLPETS